MQSCSNVNRADLKLECGIYERTHHRPRPISAIDGTMIRRPPKIILRTGPEQRQVTERKVGASGVRVIQGGEEDYGDDSPVESSRESFTRASVTSFLPFSIHQHFCSNVALSKVIGTSLPTPRRYQRTVLPAMPVTDFHTTSCQSRSFTPLSPLFCLIKI